MSTPITVIGNLTRDPELRVFENGNQVANTAVAVTDRKLVDGKWEDGNTSFFELAIFNGQSDNVCATLKKGDRVVAHGRIRIRTYDKKDGEEVVGKGYVTEVLVDEIGPSLRWASAEVTKNPKREATGARPPAGGEEEYFS